MASPVTGPWTLVRVIDGNDSVREARNGRVYARTAERVVWLARRSNPEDTYDYATKREALAAIARLNAAVSR